MQSRVLVPEQMDDPQLDQQLHVQALRGLRRINRWTGNARVALQPLTALARQLKTDRLSVLDVATGSGDVPVDLQQLARRQGLTLQFSACDISLTALEEARRQFTQAQLAADLFQADILSQEIAGEFDVVMCTTFLHHLPQRECLEALQRMSRLARHRVVVVDLVRSRMNLWQVWFACHALSRSPIVHFDGPQSVRAAFTLAEIRDLAEQAGYEQVTLRSAWPCRFVLTGSPQR